MLAVVFELTSMWSKFTDTTSARQIAALVYAVDANAVDGGQRRRVRYALDELHRKGIIVLGGAARGRNAGVTVSIPNVLPTEHLQEEKVPPPEHVKETEGAPATEERCSRDAVKVLPPTGNTEDLSEDPSPSAAPSAQEKLIDRLFEHFKPKGYDRVDCMQTVRMLAAEDIADEIIDMAITQTVAKRGQKPAYTVTVARDWKAQRTT